MGYCLLWHAVRGKSAVAVCDELGLERTGQRGEMLDTPFSGLQLPGGWYVVVADHADAFGLNPPPQELSANGELITCFVEEHVMMSNATAWRHGQMIWSISHEAANGLEDLQTEGRLPPEFSAIHDRLRAEQDAAGGSKADVDWVFEIPLQVAHALTGFRHDKTRAHDPAAFESLRIKPKIARRFSYRLRRFLYWSMGKLFAGCLLATVLFGGLVLVGLVIGAAVLIFHWIR